MTIRKKKGSIYSTYQWQRGSLRQEVLKRDGYACRLCGDQGDGPGGKGLTMAHLNPERQGGGATADELLTACRRCHGQLDGGRRYT